MSDVLDRLSLADYQDRHRGETIIVCGCGQSLNDLPLPTCCVTIGVNDVGRRFDPTYLVVLNPPGQFSGDRFRYVARSRARALFTQRDDLGTVDPPTVGFRLGCYGGVELAAPGVLHYAQNSPYVAIGLAAHMGAARIGLIGVDFTDHHFFAASGRHPLSSQLALIDRQYAALGRALTERGVSVVNLSARSRLTAFPKCSPGAFLDERGSTPAPVRPLSIVSYATTPVAGVPAVLARCIGAKTPHQARCVWARSDYGNGVAFDGDVEWTRAPAEADRLISAADLVIVHNGKIDPAHRRLLAGKPLVTMAHNYLWNVDTAPVDSGFPGVVVGQYQATLQEFAGWSVVPNPLPFWEEPYRLAPKPDDITIAYTPSGRHERFPPGDRLYWHAKGYETTMGILRRLAARRGVRLHVIDGAQVPHAEALAMKRSAHIVIDECATGSYHRNSLEGLAAGAVVVNGVGLRPAIAEALQRCAGGGPTPFVFAGLDTLEKVLERLIALGAPALAALGMASRRWMETHWQFETQWERDWQPVIDTALRHAELAAMAAPPAPVRAAGDRPVGVVIPHGGRERLDLLETTVKTVARLNSVAEIIVAEMDRSPLAREIALRHGARYVFVRSDDGFNKARVLNVGTQLARAELVLWLDNDLLLPERFLERAIEELRRRGLDCLIPWTTVLYLSAEDSRAVIAGDRPAAQCRPANLLHARQGGCGGAVLTRRRFLRDFGGLCEGFRGWGGEDNAWFHKARVLGRAAITSLPDQHLHHLFHAGSSGYGGQAHIAANPHYQQNVALLTEMRCVSDRNRFLAMWPPGEMPPCPWARGRTIAFFAEPGDDQAQADLAKARQGLSTLHGVEAALHDAGADALVVFGRHLASEMLAQAEHRANLIVVCEGAAPAAAFQHLRGSADDFVQALSGLLSVVLGAPEHHAAPRRPPPPATALVAAASGIGDLIRITPLIGALTDLGHRVDFLIAPDDADCGELFRGIPQIHRVIVHPGLSGGARPQRLGELDGARYELAVFTALASPLVTIVPARRPIAFDRDAWLARGDSRCAEEIARSLGWEGPMPAPLVRSSARRFDLPDGTIVLHPGCKPNWPWKRWHGFADLAAELASVAIVGTEQDRHHARTYFGRMTPWPAHARDYTGELSLPDTAALIAQSAALVSNDSGLMHLGVAVGTPTFGIFGITNPAREIIPAPHMHVLTKGLPCEEACRRAPYGRRDCDRHLQCLKELTAAEVVRTMNLLMPIKRPTRPSVQRAVALPAASNLLTVAIQLEGGLGDIITASSFIEALHLELGDCAIDVFHHTPDWPKFVFRDARFVRGMFANNPQQLAAGRYDIVVHLPQFVRYQVRDWARLTRINPDAARCLRVAAERFEQYRGLFERRPHLDGLWGRLSVAQGRSARSNLAWLGALSDADRPSPFLALDPSVWEGTGHLIDDGAAGYITLHDGFDITQPIEAGGATKCWPIAHWAAFAARFRQAFPDIRMVQLGAGKSRPLPGVDLNLIGRTDLHQSAWLLKHAMLHVDTDSGLVHLANAVHTQAVALFGPTDAAYYGHSANRNICSESCNNCWWSTPDWLARCPRGLSAPECMTSITPDRVFEEARQAIGRREAPVYRLVAAQLYDGAPEANRDKALATIFETLDMPPVQITRHVTEPNSGLYMHASKQWEYPFVLRHIEGRGGLDIADVGGGRGALAPCLAKLGHRVEVFDRDYLWDSGADVGIEARHRRWARTRGYAARFGSLYNLPAETAGYDAVLSVSVIEHVCAKALALRELLRLLKPGGLLIMTFDFALSPTDFQDDMRREIFGPALLAQTLATLGIAAPDFPAADIAGSAERIQHDGVLGIPEGMTVGGIVIRREAAPADGA